MDDRLKTLVMELTQALIRAKSYSGQEVEAVQILKSFLEENGFSVQVDACGSVVGTIAGAKPGKTLLFDGHIDTVPVPSPEKWQHPPFEARIMDGKIYGRGASDMKGALAAMACAAAWYAKQNPSFAGIICVAGSVHEECFEGVAPRLISQAVKPDYVVIGEASELNLKIGQRGRAEVVVETFGTPAHSANPEKGNNAVYQMCAVTDAMRSLAQPSHAVLGQGIMELTDIISGPYPGASVVPEYCRATWDRRLLTDETREGVMAPIRSLLDEAMQKNPGVRAKASYATGSEACYTGETITAERFAPGWLFDEAADFVQKVLAGLAAAGHTPQVTTYNFCTNGSHYVGEAGIPTLGFGPSRESLAHTTDEYIELNQLTQATWLYMAIIQALLA